MNGLGKPFRKKSYPKNQKNCKNQSKIAACVQKTDLFRLCPPVRYAPPVTEHVSLHSKSLCKNIARASGGCK